jgi:hypothetical protein
MADFENNNICILYVNVLWIQKQDIEQFRCHTHYFNCYLDRILLLSNWICPKARALTKSHIRNRNSIAKVTNVLKRLIDSSERHHLLFLFFQYLAKFQDRWLSQTAVKNNWQYPGVLHLEILRMVNWQDIEFVIALLLTNQNWEFFHVYY